MKPSRMRCRPPTMSTLGLSLLVCALLVLPVSPLPASADDKIRISTGIDPGSSVFLLAEMTGIFKKHKIDAEVIQAESGSRGLEMTVGGHTIASVTTELSGIRARSKGAKILIAAIIGSSREWFGVVASRQINKPEDLIGKKIGVVKGSASELYYTQFVARQNLPADKIKVVYVAAPEMIPALLRGDIDAYSCWEPWLTKGPETVPGAKILVLGGQMTGYDLVNFAYISEDLAKNRDLATRFMRALLDTEKFIKENRQQADALVAKGYRLDPKLASDLMRRLDFTVNLDTRWVDHVRAAGQWMLTHRLIEKEPDYDAFVVPDILTAVAPERVTYRRK
jgi:ABC-type nitrate/sulfonate/bicarbonate transport system substrate-binding protein